MTEEEARKVRLELDTLRNHYEQIITGLKNRVTELEKPSASGSSQPQKTKSGSKTRLE